MKDFMRRFLPNATSKLAPEIKNGVHPLVAVYGSGEPDWSLGENLTSEGYLKNPIVHRCIRMTCEAAASLPWLLFDQEEELSEHPLLELLNAPNKRQSGQAFKENLFANLLVNGNAFIHQSVLEQLPRELNLLRPDCVQTIFDQSGNPTAFEYRQGSQKTCFEINEDNQTILQIALYNPHSDTQGVSPLASAHMALDIHNAASKWNKALLDNSARPSGALVYSSTETGNLTDEQFERLKSELESGYSGASKAGRPMLLEGGLDWKAMGLTPKDMDFMEAKNGAARDIALALGVPPMLLGIPGDNTYANYAEANRSFWRQTVLPLATRVGSSIERWLTPAFGGHLKLDFDRDKVDGLSVDREALWKRLNDANFLTINEKRLATGYGALEIEDGNLLDGTHNA